MAAVTLNSQRQNVDGSWQERFYNVTGSNGNTLLTSLHVVRGVSTDNPGVVTSVSQAGVPVTLTFNSTGTYTSLNVRVVGV